ncbi:MAG: GNAT family N-acetyltransferase [Anaerolineae bacterium]|nr:GNAT family N-acetyltransferase [Anaerolineae bacterium]
MSSSVTIRRATREDLETIREIIEKASEGRTRLDAATLAERLLEWAFFVAATTKVMGVVRWQAGNFVACLKDLYVYPPRQRRRVGTPLLQRVEEEARALSCEVALLLAARQPSWRAMKFYRELGYGRARQEALARDWREVLAEHQDADEILLLKRLRETPVVVPV